MTTEAGDPAENVVAADPAVEDKARRLGWRPKEEFKGDPDRWTDADTFVKRGEDILPIVQANNKKLEKALADSKAEMADLRAQMKAASDHFSKAEERATKAAIAELERRIADGVATGDASAVTAATKEIVALSRDTPKPEPAPVNGVDAAYKAAFDEWKAENDWFDTNRPMRAYAIDLDAELAAEGMTPARRFKEIERAVREEFPDKFTNPRRDSAAAVEGSGTPPARKTGKTFNDLPVEAKTACDKWIKQGLIKDRAAYVASYEWN